MEKSDLILILIIIFGLVALSIYKFSSAYSTESEAFTSLVGLNPLTTYDNYGTFGDILQFDDLPYYDKGFKSMICGKPDYDPSSPESKRRLGGQWEPPAVDSLDNFIPHQGFKVRRELIPSNYIDTDKYSIADFDKVREVWMIKKDRPKASSKPFQAENYHFDRPVVEPYKPLF